MSLVSSGWAGTFARGPRFDPSHVNHTYIEVWARYTCYNMCSGGWTIEPGTAVGYDNMQLTTG